MKKNYKSILMIVNLLLFLVLSLINSKYIIINILDYSKLFFTKLFPVSFLFFTISTLLIDYGLIELIEFYLSINTSSLYIFIISLISGFPSGSKYTKELLEKSIITDAEANNIIMFSHFPNPLFITGSVNLVLKDFSLSLKILLSIILSNFIIFLFQKKEKKQVKHDFYPPKDFSTILSKAITNSIQTILLIYGTSLFFYLISSIICKYLSLKTHYYILLNGLFDLTKGVFSTTLINSNIIRSFYILFFISFGGLSIHMQVKSILTDTKISYINFVKGRIIGTILAFIIFIILLFF